MRRARGDRAPFGGESAWPPSRALVQSAARSARRWSRGSVSPRRAAPCERSRAAIAVEADRVGCAGQDLPAEDVSRGCPWAKPKAEGVFPTGHHEPSDCPRGILEHGSRPSLRRANIRVRDDHLEGARVVRFRDLLDLLGHLDAMGAHGSAQAHAAIIARSTGCATAPAPWRTSPRLAPACRTLPAGTAPCGARARRAWRRARASAASRRTP